MRSACSACAMSGQRRDGAESSGAAAASAEGGIAVAAGSAVERQPLSGSADEGSGHPRRETAPEDGAPAVRERRA
jgi:hypothetical protein